MRERMHPSWGWVVVAVVLGVVVIAIRVVTVVASW